MKNPGWIRRVIPDDSQSWRRAVQGLFLTLNLWIGLEFALFVLGHEGRWVPWLPQRPAGVEGWLPIAGLLNTKYFLLTGEMPAELSAPQGLLRLAVSDRRHLGAALEAGPRDVPA
jgi:hypothetical protein